MEFMDTESEQGSVGSSPGGLLDFRLAGGTFDSDDLNTFNPSDFPNLHASMGKFIFFIVVHSKTARTVFF